MRRQALGVELARKDFYPDFNLQYMWQHNAEQFRDYYVLSFGVRIPIHRSRKQRPEVGTSRRGAQSLPPRIRGSSPAILF